MTARLVLSLPLYTDVSSRFFVNFLQLDRQHIVDTIATMKVYLPVAMNQMVESALQRDDWNRLVVLEADMTPPSDVFNRMAAYPDHLDVVAAMYFQHPAPHRPVVFEQVDDDHFKHLHSSQIDHMMSHPGLWPVDGVGMGCTTIHRRVFEKWDQSTPLFHTETLGHDMHFCKHARLQGFSIHVDSGLECGHLTELPVTYETARKGIDNG